LSFKPFGSHCLDLTKSLPKCGNGCDQVLTPLASCSTWTLAENPPIDCLGVFGLSALRFIVAVCLLIF
jgi:hypothetical protein